MTTTFANPHPNVEFTGIISKDSRYTSWIAFPVEKNMAFSGNQLSIFIKQTSSVATAGPADGLGFAKKGMSMIAEGLSYRMASKIASANSKGSAELTLMQRTNGIGAAKSGRVKQTRFFVSGHKIIKLNSNQNYRLDLRPPLAGVYEIKILIEAFRRDWWA